MPQKVEIVPMTPALRDFAAALEAKTFPDPWNASAMELTSDIQLWTAACIDGVPAGYLGVQLLYGEAEVYRIAVEPSFRRQGIARALLEQLFARKDVETVFLEVRDSNAAARGLYKAMGFAEIGRRRNYYRNPAEDAVLMTWKKPETPPNYS